MMLKITQIINSLFASNTYIISNNGSNDFWLIDIGDYEKIANILPFEAKIKGVFLTHTHFDHIYGINKLLHKYPQLIVYTSKYGFEALFSEKKNFSFYHKNNIVYKGTNVFVLKEGDRIELYSNLYIDIYETPGHCPSCLTYIFNRYIFTGDSYIPNVAVVSKLPKGNKALAEQSKNRILALSLGKIICPGHNAITQ